MWNQFSVKSFSNWMNYSILKFLHLLCCPPYLYIFPFLKYKNYISNRQASETRIVFPRLFTTHTTLQTRNGRIRSSRCVICVSMLHTNTPYCSGSGKSKEGNVFGLLSDACRNDGMNYWCRGHPSIWKVYTSWWLLLSCWPNSAKVHSLMYCYCIYSADAFSSRTITGADIWKLLTVLLSTYMEGPATTLPLLLF